MVDKITITARAYKDCTFATVGDVRVRIGEIADNNNLDVVKVNPCQRPDDDDISGVVFVLRKTGLNESALQNINDTWKAVCDAEGYKRKGIRVDYYTAR